MCVFARLCQGNVHVAHGRPFMCPHSTNHNHCFCLFKVLGYKQHQHRLNSILFWEIGKSEPAVVQTTCHTGIIIYDKFELTDFHVCAFFSVSMG